MSRLFIVLLSFYCLFLAVLPCHCSEPEVPSHAHITSVSGQDCSHRTDTRICTPFCICSGVHNPNFFIKNQSLLIVMAPVETFFYGYTESVCHYHRIDIWRPPKK